MTFSLAGDLALLPEYSGCTKFRRRAESMPYISASRTSLLKYGCCSNSLAVLFANIFLQVNKIFVKLPRSNFVAVGKRGLRFCAFDGMAEAAGGRLGSTSEKSDLSNFVAPIKTRQNDVKGPSNRN